MKVENTRADPDALISVTNMSNEYSIKVSTSGKTSQPNVLSRSASNACGEQVTDGPADFGLLRPKLNLGMEFPLHEHGVHPLVELEAHREERACGTEVEVLVQANGSGVRTIANDRDHLPPGASLAMFDQACKQCASVSSPDMGGIYINGVFHGIPICETCAVRTGVRVADDRFLLFGNQKRQAERQDGGTALRHLVLSGWVQFESCAAVADVVAIDARDRA
jgi:hypothetical protein